MLVKVELIDKMGNDLTISNAARVSFAKEKDELDDKDVKLINYLAKHNHWTPFGHVQATIRVTAPIFLARQLVKHQVGLVWNEVSRRYVDDIPDFHTPSAWRSRAENKKQGSGEYLKNDLFITDAYLEVMKKCLDTYEFMLQNNVAPEQARMILPQSIMTQWYWTGSLAAFARIYKLRSEKTAQMEAQVFAEKLGKIMEPLFPNSWRALTTYEEKESGN